MMGGSAAPARGARRAGWRSIGAALVGSLGLVAALPTGQVQARVPARVQLAGPERVAEGIDLFRSTDATVLDASAPGPLQIALVRLDPLKVRLGTALAQGCAPARAPVAEIASREGAVVALNGGFFALPTGAPLGLLKHRGRWIGAASRARGAVAFVAEAPKRPARLVFDRVTFAPEVRVRRGLRWTDVRVDRLSGTGTQGGVTFSAAPCPVPEAGPAAGTGTPDDGGDSHDVAVARTWRLRGVASTGRQSGPPGFAERHGVSGRWVIDSGVPVPAAPGTTHGAALLTFRGPSLPAAFATLREGQVITIDGRLLAPDARVWRDALDAVGGAGLLVSRGHLVTDWSVERTDRDFRTGRHPRSVIGVDRAGAVWLIAVDGRQPAWSVGMSFAELQRLSSGLDLRDALNLDGGGSTTLVVRGRVVNRPSDLTGPRAVSDAVVVHSR